MSSISELSSRRIVTCLGASLTEGTVSANYVKLLETDPTLASFEFRNHGRNGDLLWNGLKRLEALIAEKPEIVTIMMGTNDVNCTLSERNRIRYVEFNRLPRSNPDLGWFVENLETIVHRVQTECGARVALLSLPMIGEDLDHIANHRLRLYNAAIADVALRLNASFLDVHGRMIRYLEEHQADRAHLPPRMEYKDGLTLVGMATALKARGMSWNEIAHRHGLLLLTDCLHLNETAAALVAEILAAWLKTV